MLDSATVLELRKGLQGARDARDTKTCLEVLEKLDEGVVATEEMLRETKIGVAVNKVAQSAPSPEVAAKSEALVQKWRTAVHPRESKSRSPSLPASAASNTTCKAVSPTIESILSQVKEEQGRSASPAVPADSASSSSNVTRPSFSTTLRASLAITTSSPPVPLKRPAWATPLPELPAPPAAKKQRESAPPFRTHKGDAVCFDKIFPGAEEKREGQGKGKGKKGGRESKDETEKNLGKASSAARVRASCCEAMYDAIACDSTSETETLAAKAIEIERAVWERNPPSDKTTPTQAYRSKVRFLYQNLKAPGNRALRMKLVDGDFEVDKLVVCSSADFRTAEQRALEEEVRKRSLQNACFDATSTLGEAMRETMKWRGGGR
ncbi:transcription elongation factor TFIIS [Rhodotorula toruloides]